MIGLAIPKAWLAGGGAAVLLASLTASHGCVYFKGRAAGAASVEAKYDKALAKARAALAKGQAKIDSLESATATARATQDQESRSITHETLRIVERPVYRTVCVDADGVGLLDRAAANANRTPDFLKPAD